MSNWSLNNSVLETIFDYDLAVIEAWNDVIFLYSKIVNDNEIYKKNYLFFTSSTNSPFSKMEVVECIDYAFELLANEDFSKSLSKDDRVEYFEMFREIKFNVLEDPSHTFTTSVL